MVEKVTKNKVEWQRKTYPLKLILSNEQKERIDTFLEEYQKVTNFIIQKCTIDLFPFFKQIDKTKLTTKKCKLCNKEKQLRYEWKTPNQKKELNCGCLNGHFSLRKLFLPSENYKITQHNSLAEWDIRFAGKLYDGFPNLTQGGDSINGSKYNRTIYDSCLQKAVETIKSQNALNKKIDFEIKYFSQKNDEINRFLKNQLDIEKDKELIEKMQGICGDYPYKKTKLKRILNKNIERLRRLSKKRAEKVTFKGNMARLYNTVYNWQEINNGNYCLQLTAFEKPMYINFFGKSYQKIKAKDFVCQEKQPEIELLKRDNTYFIQYIYRQAPKVPTPDNTFTAIGVDFGILNYFTIACLKKDSKKPFGIKFWNGRIMRRKRRQYYKIRRIWQKKTRFEEKGGKGKSLIWFKKKCLSQNEKNFVKTEMHKQTANLVQWIFNNVKSPVIVLEDLKDIREETKKMKRSHLLTLRKQLKGTTKKWYLKERYLNKELNNWNFKMMHDFIKYKAEWLGIPVVVLPAKNTSIKCNKCGNVDERNYVNLHKLLFECLTCGYRCNVDFNAAVNLAKNYFEKFSAEKNEKKA